jgi:CheY-like chemotaxis protein
MESRRLILQHAGHTVITARDERELTSACAKHEFDVAVIGQATSPKVKKALVQLLREKCPATRILELYPLYQGKTLEDADAWLEAPINVPHELAERVTELATRPKKSTNK